MNPQGQFKLSGLFWFFVLASIAGGAARLLLQVSEVEELWRLLTLVVLAGLAGTMATVLVLGRQRRSVFIGAVIAPLVCWLLVLSAANLLPAWLLVALLSGLWMALVAADYPWIKRQLSNLK